MHDCDYEPFKNLSQMVTLIVAPGDIVSILDELTCIKKDWNRPSVHCAPAQAS